MAKSKEEIAAQKRNYYQTNKDRLNAKREEWRKAHPAEWAARERRRRAKHVDADRERARSWYDENKDRVLPHLKSKRDALRAEALQAYGGKCACCGESNPRFLTIDHINGGGVKHRRAIGGSGNSILTHLKRLDWPQEGYQLLCFNCNCGRAYNGGVCPHVSTSSD